MDILWCPECKNAVLKGASAVLPGKSYREDGTRIQPIRPKEQKVMEPVEYEGRTECPRGHGPLKAWEGKPRCWTCGWPER